MYPSAALYCVLLLSAAGTGVSSRQELNFDFGWKFRVGGAEVSCPASAFPKNLTGVQCIGLGKSGAQSPDECRDACCGDPTCEIWQFESTGISGGGCWMGQSDNCEPNKPKWVGAGRSAPGPPGPTPPPAKPGFNDSTWDRANLPHDFLITAGYDEATHDGGHGFIPRNDSWYRKTFVVPSEWKGDNVFLYFEGVFRIAQVWFNGEYLGNHTCGYTSFWLRLDDHKINWGQHNLIALYVNAISHSGWWYEGGGLYRHVKMIHTNPLHLHIEYGSRAYANITGPISAHSKGDPSKGQSANAEIHLLSYIENYNTSTHIPDVATTWQIMDKHGKQIATVTSAATDVPPNQMVTQTGKVSVANAELWSIPRTYMYTVVAQVKDKAGFVFDSTSVDVGVREGTWTADKGFWLNNERVKIRGFCDHNDFTGVGMALPDRVNLFRAQAMRSVGGNGWRMSHNPPTPELLNVLDQVGIVAMDENRIFDDKPQDVENMAQMVLRDRDHPSVVIWSFCNEGGCDGNGQKYSKQFRDITYQNDGTRPVTANMNGQWGKNGQLTSQLDVQGFSHRNPSVFNKFHQQFPNKPIVASECCSCETQRGEDDDLPRNSSVAFFSNFNAPCIEEQVGWSYNLDYMTGTFVWTLFDYYGEAHKWPAVNSAYGSFDLSGFAKAGVYWYRSWWLGNVSQSDWGRPAVPPTTVCHIVERNWDSTYNKPRTVHVYTNADSVVLLLNGKPIGTGDMKYFSYVTFKDVTYAPGSLKAHCITAGKMMASDTVATTGAAAAIVLSIDAPSPTTGTGSAVVADGEDIAMLRATIVDSQKRVVPMATNNVTFTVVSGPGMVWGMGNGDPACHEPNHAHWRSAYHGLVRCIIRSVQTTALKEWHILKFIDVDYDHEKHRDGTAMGITVRASSPGLASSTITIPVTNDLNELPAKVAARSLQSELKFD